MRDTLVWTSLLGVIGWLADAWFLKAHLACLIRERGLKLKEAAELWSYDSSI